MQEEEEEKEEEEEEDARKVESTCQSKILIAESFPAFESTT